MTDLFTAPVDRRAALRRLSAVLGGIATVPLMSGVLAGCRTPAAGEAYTYQTLSAPQQSQLAALVDQILPATDTPGASDVGVPQFIDKMLSGWYSEEEKADFLAGLAEIDRRSEGGSFAALDADAQAALVTAIDAETYAAAPAAAAQAAPRAAPDSSTSGGVDAGGDVAGAAQQGTYQADEQREDEVAGTQGPLGGSMEAQTGTAGGPPVPKAPPFFRQLKELTLAGYYTSEAGATQELQWLAAPGKWTADAPLSEIGRSWA